MSDRITWLLPVKNGMPYLPETLASIETQTYHNWEILAWDNGSTDATIDTLKQWIPNRLPGRIITSHPMGLGASLAEMVQLAQTEFCARIDADDTNLPERLERQVNFLRHHPEVAVVGTQMNRLDGKGVNHGCYDQLPQLHNDIIHSLMYRNGMSHPTVLFRRSTVLASGNYRDVGRVNIEDYDLWLRVASRYKLANLEIPLVNYRVHENSATQLAIQQNTLMNAVYTRFSEHAQELYGCSSAEALLLREHKLTNTIRLLKQVALHLDKGNQELAKARFRSATFLAAGQALVCPRDIRSRLILAAYSTEKDALLNELKSLCDDAFTFVKRRTVAKRNVPENVSSTNQI